jgi:hypothetical protein
MDKARLKIHLFRVEPSEGTEPLEDLLKHMKADSIAKRVKRCSLVDYRLEDCNAPKQKGGIWELNFVRMRDAHGPGKVSRTQPLSGFDLEENEYFGEDTAVLYDASTRYAIVQYNHWGVRVSGLESYFTQYRDDVTNLYTLKPKLDLTAERRYKDQNITRRIEIGIDLTKMQDKDLKARRSLTQMAEIGNDVGADRLYLTLSIGSRDRKSRLKDSGKRLIDAVRAKLGSEAVVKLTAYGSEKPEQPFEVVDLLEEKLEHFEDVDVGVDRRISFENRIKALRRAKSKWSALMKD